MTIKQHTKFHISCIKDHACRHKSLAAIAVEFYIPVDFYNCLSSCVC